MCLGVTYTKVNNNGDRNKNSKCLDYQIPSTLLSNFKINMNNDEINL